MVEVINDYKIILRKTKGDRDGRSVADSMASCRTSDTNVIVLVTQMSSGNCYRSLTSVISKIGNSSSNSAGQGRVVVILEASWRTSAVRVLAGVL